jgi:hypothetical protein
MSATILRPLIVQRRVAQIRIAPGELNAEAAKLAVQLRTAFDWLAI